MHFGMPGNRVALGSTLLNLADQACRSVNKFIERLNAESIRIGQKSR
jgi:hypothetical protein